MTAQTLARPDDVPASRGVAFGFFAFAVLCVAAGMVWGLVMAATHDHAMAPAHAHLNLVGWATMGLFGLYYVVTPAAAESRLAKLHLPVAAAGVVAMVPGIALAELGLGEGLAIVGSLLTLVSMAVFVAVVMRFGLGRPES